MFVHAVHILGESWKHGRAKWFFITLQNTKQERVLILTGSKDWNLGATSVKALSSWVIFKVTMLSCNRVIWDDLEGQIHVEDTVAGKVVHLGGTTRLYLSCCPKVTWLLTCSGGYFPSSRMDGVSLMKLANVIMGQWTGGCRTAASHAQFNLWDLQIGWSPVWSPRQLLWVNVDST